MNWPWTLTKVTIVDTYYKDYRHHLTVQSENGRLYTKRVDMGIYHADKFPEQFMTRLFFWKAI